MTHRPQAAALAVLVIVGTAAGCSWSSTPAPPLGRKSSGVVIAKVVSVPEVDRRQIARTVLETPHVMDARPTVTSVSSDALPPDAARDQWVLVAGCSLVPGADAPPDVTVTVEDASSVVSTSQVPCDAQEHRTALGRLGGRKVHVDLGNVDVGLFTGAYGIVAPASLRT